MHSTAAAPSTRRHRLALFATSTMTGFGIASWVTRTPAVRQDLGASIEAMGFVLFGLSIGSMTGILGAGALIRRLGTRPLVLVGAALPVLGILLVGLCAPAQLAAGVWAGLFLVGFGAGVAEIGLNVEAAAVERLTDRPVVPVLHACFSLGTVAGGIVGIVMTAAHTPVVVHLPIAAVVMAALAVFAATNLRPLPRTEATSDAGPPRPETTGRRRSVITLQLVSIAVITLAMAFAEGAASDWLPLLMTTDHDAPEVLGSLVFTGFALAMLVGRSAGTPLVTRFGRGTVVRACAVVGLVGVLVVVVSPSPFVTAGAAVVWGLGIALGFPLAVSAAGDHPTDGDRRVSVVATAGYIAFLVGPPALGFLGEHLGLRIAMLVPAALLAITIVIASAAGRQRADVR